MIKFLIILFFIPGLTYAQYKVPCLTKKTTLDLSCSCKKTKSCYHPLKKVDRKIYKRLHNNRINRKLTKIAMKAHDAESGLYSGKIQPDGKEFKALDKLNTKLSKARKQRVKRYEKFLKKKGSKKWKMKDRIAIANKRLLKNIPKEKLKRLQKSGFQTSFAKFFAEKSGIKGFTPYRTNPKNGVILAAEDDDEAPIQVNTQSGTDASANTEFAINQQGLDEARKKKYKFDTIIKKPEASLFKVISNRYVLVIDRLDQRTIARASRGVSKEELISSIKSFLKSN